MNTKVQNPNAADFSRLAGTHLPFAGVFNWLVTVVKQRRQQLEDRAAFETVLRLDDRQLKDIGVRRIDVEWASKLPLKFNAADELRKISSKVGRMGY